MAQIEMLEEAKWSLIGLDLTTVARLVTKLDRLAARPSEGGARRLAGTSHLYRVRWEGCTILYHHCGERMTILVVRRRRAEDALERWLRGRRKSKEAGRRPRPPHDPVRQEPT